MKTLLKAGLVVLLSVLWACAPITPLFPQPPQSQSQGGQSGSSGGGSSGGGSSGGGSSGGSSSGGGGSSGGGAGLPSPGGLPGLPGGIPGGPPGGPGGQPGGQSGGQPGSEGGSPGAGEPLPTGPGGNVPGGEQGDGDGSDPLGGNDPLGGEGSEEGELAWEVLESGGAGEAGGEDGSPPGDPGAGEESWEQGESGPPGGGGWEVSNEVVAPVERVGAPPMPAGSDGSAGEDELDKALEEFDGEILAERAVLEQRSNENLGGRPGPGGPIASGSPATPDAGTVSDPFPQSRQVPSPPMPQRTAGAQVPDDVPDARDDDIIARQLREAAMVENDPVLREKLWDEYRRYKGS